MPLKFSMGQKHPVIPCCHFNLLFACCFGRNFIGRRQAATNSTRMARRIWRCSGTWFGPAGLWIGNNESVGWRKCCRCAMEYRNLRFAIWSDCSGTFTRFRIQLPSSQPSSWHLGPSKCKTVEKFQYFLTLKIHFFQAILRSCKIIFLIIKKKT